MPGLFKHTNKRLMNMKVTVENAAEIKRRFKARYGEGYFIYFVYAANQALLYVGTVTTEGVVCPSDLAPYPCNEPWWKEEAKYVIFADQRLSPDDFECLQPAASKPRSPVRLKKRAH